MTRRLTVFTPTYNRAHLLPRLYESLCRQTSRDFLWMVIDDGSTDNTRRLIETWQEENKIEIRYFHKKNGGMHTGHNLAYKKTDTELNVCIDSDDYMPDTAVHDILCEWDAVADKEKTAGLIGLDADKNGSIIGTPIPKDLRRGSLTDLYDKYKVTGDKKIVLRTDIVRNYPPYPEYENEKLVPLGILYGQIGEDYDFQYSNTVYCIVEYQPEGSSRTILNQYRQSPRGFAHARKTSLTYSRGFKNRFIKYIHLTSSAILAKDLSLAFKNTNPVCTILAFPPGILLTIYVMIKTRK